MEGRAMWEYMRMQVSVNAVAGSDDATDKLGREGWELVCVVEAAASYLHFFFKRPRR
jgi:hypothetical protein